MIAKPLRKVRGVRPLCFNNSSLYCANRNKILVTDDLGETFRDVGSFQSQTGWLSLAGHSRLFRRVFRMTVYRLRALTNGNLVFLFKGGVFLLRAGQARGEFVFPVTEGSRPVSLAYKPGGLVVWGEYHGNLDRRAVRIFGSRDFGVTWQPVHTFAPGEIRHVHGITFDPHDDCFWICTGDHHGEERLVKASADFSTVKPILCGGQMNRFYSVVATKDSLFMATDSPNADNYIRKMNKATETVVNVARIDNSSFYSCQVGDWYFCSTNTERPERPFPRTSSRPNDCSATHVWMVNTQTDEVRRILSFPADIWFKLSGLPGAHPGLFQYTRMFLAEGENPSPHLVCHAQGTRQAEDSMLVYSLDDLKEQAACP